MAIHRDAAVIYAKRFWNRVCDDDKFWTDDDLVSLAAKRREMHAPVSILRDEQRRKRGCDIPAHRGW
jgi:hypothetical protein